jgi:outer membrane cobalamin receptor
MRAQDVTATLNGTVHDSSGGVMPAANVTVTNDATGVARVARTNAGGYFAFTDLQIGSYSLRIEMSGFRAYRQSDITLTAGQIRTLGDIRMKVGDVAETVTVQANALSVELASGEKSGVITRRDLEETAIRGRDYLDMLRLLPGVVDESDGREAPGPDGIRSLFINGARDNQKNVTIDGVTSMDSGSNGTTHTAPTLGAIAEVKVLTSAYQAEFGRAVGGTIIVTTRGGGNQYHGAGFWSHRHEEYNANDYFNNQRGLLSCDSDSSGEVGRV